MFFKKKKLEKVSCKYIDGFLMAQFKSGRKKKWIDIYPVRQCDFIKFIHQDIQGYYNRRYWEQDSAGQTDEALKFLDKQSGNSIYKRLSYDRKDYPLNGSVMSVNWYEARSFAKWRRARLLELSEWKTLIEEDSLIVFRDVTQDLIDQICPQYPACTEDSSYTLFTHYGTLHKTGGKGFLEWTNTKASLFHSRYAISITNSTYKNQILKIQEHEKRSDSCADIVTFRCLKEE
jgi:hypothetical protein